MPTENYSLVNFSGNYLVIFFVLFFSYPYIFRRYVCGNKITIPDIRAFVTLIRFDEVYVVYFKTNKKMIRHAYPNIFNYIKDIYQSYEVYKSVRSFVFLSSFSFTFVIDLLLNIFTLWILTTEGKHG